MDSPSSDPGGILTHSPPPPATTLPAIHISDFSIANRVSASVSIPQDVLQSSVPLWSNCCVGHFIGDAPHIGKVHATVNRIWNSASSPFRVDAQFLSPKVVLFRIPNSAIRERVLHRRFWYIGDVPLVVQIWSPSTVHSKPDLSSFPLWVDFHGVPDELYGDDCLKLISKEVGSFQRLHPNTERCVRLDVARILLEVDLNKPLISDVRISGDTEHKVVVRYPWLPTHCEKCSCWGHLAFECSKSQSSTTATILQNNLPNSEVPPASPPAKNMKIVSADQTSSQDKPPAPSGDQPPIIDSNRIATLLADLQEHTPIHTAEVGEPSKLSETESSKSREEGEWSPAHKPVSRESSPSKYQPPTFPIVESAFAVLRDVTDPDNAADVVESNQDITKDKNQESEEDASSREDSSPPPKISVPKKKGTTTSQPSRNSTRSTASKRTGHASFGKR